MDLLYSPAGGLRVIGAMTSERRYDLPAGSRSIGIRFRPGMARAFFRIPAHKLTDQLVAAQELLGAPAKEAESRLAAARSAEECMRIMLALIGAPTERLNPVQRAIEAIAAQPGTSDLDEIASQANLSPRQFRRRCLEESGLGPKQLSRILRFRRALEFAARNIKPEWAGIALKPATSTRPT